MDDSETILFERVHLCKKLKRALYILFIVFAGANLFAQYEVNYDTTLEEAYALIIDLDFEKAENLIAGYKKNKPNNLAYLHLENYIDFFKLFIYEDLDYFNKVKANKEYRIDLLEQLPTDNPFRDFIIAEINLQWALTRSKFDELFKAGREVYAAYKLLEKNTEKFPDFIYNYKSLSIIHSMVETIEVPGVFKNIFGMSGTVTQGLTEIQQVNDYADNHPFIFELEAEAIYIFMALYQENNQELAFNYLEETALNYSQSPLATFVKVKLLQRAGKNDEAIDLLLETLSYTSVKEFPYLYFLMGVSNLRKLNEEAVSYFNEYLDYFEGIHYIKEAHQKLGWSALIFENDEATYHYQMQNCLTEGSAMIDDDKQALQEANKLKVPNRILLRARLLYDGGYYQKAYQELIKNSKLFYKDEVFKMEYFYRLARITQALKNYPEAIQYYHQTMASDEGQRSYMTCNAALHLGIIYESQNDLKKAKKYFNQCLQLNPTEYRLSLHQKAKTGLNRISN